MIIINIISFLLDGLLSLVLDKDSIFLSLFSIVSLLLIYPHILKKEKIYIYSAITGFLYDIVYTQTPFLNTIIFLLISMVIYFYFKLLPMNFQNSLFLLFLIILIFRVCTFFIQVLVGNINLEFNLLFKSFYTSIFSNIMYFVLVYFILKKLYQKKKKGLTYNYKI